MTMVPDPQRQNALTPKQGALSHYIEHHMVPELYADHMPDIVLHEYEPFLDSSDLGPDEFANVARDIYTNYLYFDGFVVVTGTDTMAYFATALSFMMENLGKPIVFTGSQIPLCYPYNDARHNLIMAILFASRGGGGPGRASMLTQPEPPLINEVTIFFHDRLLRANRSTKVNTHQLLAFDSPNMKPLATIGISIQDTDPSGRLLLPPPQGPLRVHTQLDTRMLTLRLVPGFDDAMISHMIEQSIEKQLLKALVLQLYGTGNMPSVKESFIDLLAYARHQCGILVVATTQCLTGSVQFGHYAVGAALEQRAGVLSAYDMTMEATVYKLAYLFGQSELSTEQISELMPISLRGEITTQPQSHSRR
jgi:L-asparaginase